MPLYPLVSFSIGLKSKAYYSLFFGQNGSSFTAILIYVDDMLVTRNDMNEIQKVKKLLNTQFHMKDMGALGYFLDLEVSRTDQGISVSQKKYTLDFLMESGLQDTKVLKLSLD